MNGNKIGTETCYVHQHTFVGTLSMSVSQSCLMQSLYYTSNFLNFLLTCLLSFFTIYHCKKEVVVLTSVLVTSVALHDYNLSWY